MLLGVVVGLIIFFFLKDVFFAPIVSGFVAGFLAKGPISGVIAGALVILLGVFLSSLSSLTAISVLNSLNTSITGFSFANVEPLDLVNSLLSVKGVVSAAAAGLIGGFLSKR